MSDQRFDIVSPRPRKNSDKPYWHRVGTAFQGERGLTLFFDSLPIPDSEGRTMVKLFEAKPKQNLSDRADQTFAQQGGGQLDSEIPFGPEVR